MRFAKNLVPQTKLKDRQQRTVKQWAERNAKFKERFGSSKGKINIYRTHSDARQSEEAKQILDESAVDDEVKAFDELSSLELIQKQPVIRPESVHASDTSVM